MATAPGRRAPEWSHRFGRPGWRHGWWTRRGRVPHMRGCSWGSSRWSACKAGTRTRLGPTLLPRRQRNCHLSIFFVVLTDHRGFWWDPPKHRHQVGRRDRTCSGGFPYIGFDLQPNTHFSCKAVVRPSFYLSARDSSRSKEHLGAVLSISLEGYCIRLPYILTGSLCHQ